MLFDPGFLGTRAALFMDIVTLYFLLLPFLVIYSIRYAIKGLYQKHYVSQIAILGVTMAMVVLFEVGVRYMGGFMEFIKESSINHTFFYTFLIIHILIALVMVVSWLILISRSYKAYKKEGKDAKFFKQHRIFARWVFLGISITSIMGCMIYGFLFL